MGEFNTGLVIFYLLEILTTGRVAMVVELSNIFLNSWGEFGIGRVYEPHSLESTKFSSSISYY
jgi:hypothetical protein